MQRRILSLVIFLLTLFPLLGIVDGSAVMAQHWTYEDGSNWLPDVDVGSTNEKCETCGHFYDPEEGHECWYKCEYCYEIVSDLNKHYERSQACAIAAGYKEEEVSHCPFCGRELEEEEYCTCANLVVPGTKPSGGGAGGGSSGGSGSGGTGGGSSNSSEDTRGTVPPSYSKTLKSKVVYSKLVVIFFKSVYNRYYNRATCGYCLRGWKTVWKKAGIGEYAPINYAKDFGNTLIRYGFKVIYSGNKFPTDYTPQIGDTRVWDSYPGQKVPAGHIDWWNGTNWVSDYVQQGKWYPGPKYEKYHVSYKIYR